MCSTCDRHMHTHACTHAHTHTHARTHARTHTHTHTEREREREREREGGGDLCSCTYSCSSDADKPSNNELVVPVPHIQPPELLPVSRPHPAPSSLTITGTEFTNITRDDVEEHWREHVSILLKNKSGTAAVNTIFLLNRLFLVGGRGSGCGLSRG